MAVTARTMTKILTYVDSSILIQAVARSTAGTFARRMRALQILNDPDRSFVSSSFLKLEVLPKARWFNKKREIEFYEKFFRGVENWAPDADLISPALDLATEYGLGALDALHIIAAKHFEAEFVSAERPTKPIYRAYANISSIYED